MGLDIAELMIVLEEEFNVEIFETDAGKIETVGDLIDMIDMQLTGSPVTPEQAERHWAEGLGQARRYLAETLEIEPDLLAEQTKLAELFPRERRDTLWKTLQSKSPRIPDLYPVIGCFPAIGVVVVALMTIILAAIATDYFSGLTVFIVSMIVISAALAAFGTWSYASRENVIDPNLATVADLARRLVPSEVRLDPHGKPWERKTIETMVFRLIAAQAGCEPEEILASMKIADLF